MEIIEYFASENKEYWLSRICDSNWDAGKYLGYLLKSGEVFSLLGQGTRVLLLTEGDELCAFCTLAEMDDIQPTDLTPWVGFVYTFEKFRGKGLMGRLLSQAESLAAADGKGAVYISTGHIGLYEKYGYEFLQTMKNINGEDSRAYVKHL